jgi:hypothetical protein
MIATPGLANATDSVRPLSVYQNSGKRPLTRSQCPIRIMDPTDRGEPVFDPLAAVNDGAK